MDDKVVSENKIEFKDYSDLDVKLNKIGYYHSKINNFRVQIPENWILQKGQLSLFGYRICEGGRFDASARNERSNPRTFGFDDGFEHVIKHPLTSNS